MGGRLRTTPIGCLLLAVTLAAQLVAAWQPVGWIVTHLTFDDTFLLLRVAQQWAEHGFPTFDGLHRTNGFQAAWGVLVWLLAGVARDHVQLLHLALTLAAVLNTLTGFLLWQYARRLSPGPLAGLWVLAFWTAFCLTPRPSQCGLENALVGTCVAAGLVTWQRLRARETVRVEQGAELNRRARPSSLAVLLVTLTGLAVWARLDLAAIVAVVWAALGVSWLRQRRYGDMVMAGLIGGALAGGLLTFNWWAGETLTPVSGMVKRLIAERHEQMWTPAGLGDALLDSGSALLKYASVGVGAIWPPALSSAVRVAFIMVASLALLRGWLRLRAWIVVWGAALAAHVLALRLWLGDYHLDTMWYFMPEQLSAAVLAGVICARWQGSLGAGRPRVTWPVLVGVAKIPLLLAILLVSVPADTLAATRLTTANWLRENVPPGDRIAAWNAGELSYFSQRTVINLDGLVNSRAYYERLRDSGSIAKYLVEKRVGWVVDYAATASDAGPYYWGTLARGEWEPVGRFGTDPRTMQFVIRRASANANPPVP